MSWHNSYQVWLSYNQSMENAQLVANHLSSQGWTAEAISALVGNMRHESSVNPNMYEYGYGWNQDRGFGLVQWTPRSKYWNWALQNGYAENELRDGNAQLARIDYEVDQNIQWISTPNYPLSFSQFRSATTSDYSIDYLTRAFTWNYERPNLQAGENSMPDRIAFAEDAYNTLDFSGDGGSSIPDGVQLAQMPIDYIHITQGEWGEYHTIGTHNAGTGQELAMDFIFPTIQYRLYAPFDIELMMQDPNYATNVWKSTTPVMAVDGTIYDELHIIVIHDDFWYTYDVGMTRKQGEYFGNSGNATGNYGISTGDHLHFEVMKGHTYQFPPASSNQLSIYDVFDTSNVESWIEPRHYDWKEWDGDIPGNGGDNGGSDPDPDPTPDPDPEPDPWQAMVSRFISNLLDELEDRLTTDVHKQGDSDYYKNSFLILQKQLENSYKVKPNLQLFDELADEIQKFLRDFR